MTSYKELQEQIARLQDEASIARKTELKAAIASIREQMALFGITVDDLGGTKKSPKSMSSKSAVQAKYRDPRHHYLHTADIDRRDTTSQTHRGFYRLRGFRRKRNTNLSRRTYRPVGTL